MVSPTRPFLEKSARAGASSFLSQKKAEAERGREPASSRTAAAAKRERCFNGMTSLLMVCL